MAVITTVCMKPKILPVIELCIENGVTIGYRRAFKHTDNPTEEQIFGNIREAIVNELYEWFTFETELWTNEFRGS